MFSTKFHSRLLSDIKVDEKFEQIEELIIID